MSQLLSISLAIAAGLFVLIWIVQAIVYPGFLHIEKEEFKQHHKIYSRRMGYIAGPLMVAQLAVAGFLLVKNISEITSFLYFGAICSTWVTTFTISVPLHNKLQKSGKDPATIIRLVTSNWIRTLTWSVTFGATLYRVTEQ